MKARRQAWKQIESYCNWKMVAWNRVSTNRDDTQDMFWYGWDITQIKYKVRNEGLGFNVISMSVQLFVSDSLRPHGLKHARFPCPSPTPRAYSNSCPLSRWCHPTISSSVVPFSSHLQSFPASGSFQMSQFFSSVGQSIGVSALASVLPMNIQDWLPLG